MTDKKILASIKEGEAAKGRNKEILDFLSKNERTTVILDDDPTGTQTVHNTPVLMEWSGSVLERELLKSPVFFILTNSRSLQREEAEKLNFQIGKTLALLSREHSKNLIVISRSDSTLRGHFPDEVFALCKGLDAKLSSIALIPAFFEGGRYTHHDVHYVREGNEFIPASQTPFADDSTFGYSNSDLRKYMVEKSDGRIEAEEVQSIDLNMLRTWDTKKIVDLLESGSKYFVVNATAYSDLENFALAALDSKRTILYRTAASFINAITGIRPIPCLKKETIVSKANANGGLVVIGSYVPKTTAQLNYLKSNYDAEYFELEISTLLEDTFMENGLKELAYTLDGLLADGKNIVVFTERKLVKGDTKEESLRIVNRVSNAVTALVAAIKVRPNWVIAKGGITSNDIAVKSLGIKRALVIGQIIKGVPVWQTEYASRFADMPYIVFPGNVGTEKDLYNVIQRLK